MINPMEYWRNWWNELSVVEQTIVVFIFAAAIIVIFISPASAAEVSTSMEAVWLALIVAVPATLSAPIMAWLTNRTRHQEKMEDYARQDVIADKANNAAKEAAQAARSVKDQAAEAARLLDMNNKAVASTAAETQAQLKVIHTLVNSNMTSAMQAELDARRDTLVLMLEIVELKKAKGKEKPAAETLLAIGAAKGKIVELEMALADRLKQSKEIDKLQNKKTIAQLKKT